MRALVINSMFVNAMYRRCADELGSNPNMDLTVFMPESWRMNGSILALDPLRVDSPYRMVTGRAGWKGFENRGFYTSGLLKAFRQSSPDVLFLMEEPFSLFALEVSALQGLLGLHIPTVFFTWNNLSLDKFDYRPSWFYRNVAKYNLKNYTRAVTANSDAVRVLREAGFRKPVTAIGYGVDTEKFSYVNDQALRELRASLGISGEDHVIGYVGRLLKMKGVDLLIEAFAALLREGEPKLKLLLLGSGDDQSAFLEQARRLGIEEQVRHVQNVPQEEVPMYIHLLDTLVLPSRRQGMWAEQFGRVLIEAMSAGRIVLGSTSGAIPEVIGNGGLTFLEDDASDLKEKLRSILLLLPDERATIVAHARDRATNYFSWKNFAERASLELRAAALEKNEAVQ